MAQPALGPAASEAERLDISCRRCCLAVIVADETAREVWSSLLGKVSLVTGGEQLGQPGQEAVWEPA